MSAIQTARTTIPAILAITHETTRVGLDKAYERNLTLRAERSTEPHACLITTDAGHKYTVRFVRDEDEKIAAKCSCAGGTFAPARGQHCYHVAWLLLRSPELTVSLAPRHGNQPKRRLLHGVRYEVKDCRVEGETRFGLLDTTDDTLQFHHAERRLLDEIASRHNAPLPASSQDGSLQMRARERNEHARQHD